MVIYTGSPETHAEDMDAQSGNRQGCPIWMGMQYLVGRSYIGIIEVQPLTVHLIQSG